jgi:hypothetical protein
MSIESLKTEPVRAASLLARAEGRGVNLVFLGAQGDRISEQG